MAKICPRYVQDMPEICTSFAQGMGIQIDKVGQNVAGEGALVGTYVAEEVRDAVGHFVSLPD